MILLYTKYFQLAYLCALFRALTLHSKFAKNNNATTLTFRVGGCNPLTHQQFDKVIRRQLQWGKITQTNYASDSFQIGVATTVTAAGLLA